MDNLEIGRSGVVVTLKYRKEQDKEPVTAQHLRMGGCFVKETSRRHGHAMSVMLLQYQPWKSANQNHLPLALLTLWLHMMINVLYVRLSVELPQEIPAMKLKVFLPPCVGPMQRMKPIVMVAPGMKHWAVELL